MECRPPRYPKYTDRDYFTLWLNKLSEQLDERFRTQQEAIKLSQDVINARLEGMNEFRATISDQNKNYITKAEYGAKLEAINTDLRILREAKAVAEGKASQSSVIFLGVVSVIGLLVSLISLVVKFI